MRTEVVSMGRGWLFLLCCGLWCGACQESKEPTTTLTQAQWEEVRLHIAQAPPAKVAHAVGANYGEKIELIGIDIEPEVPKAGQEMTVTYHWKALASMEINWQVFVHFDHKGPPPTRQGLDHHPVRDLYQTTRWEPGQIVKDIQKVRVRGDYPDGDAVLWVGLWDPSSGKRLPLTNKDKVTNDGSDRVKAATLKVAGKKGGAGKPAAKDRPKVHMARPLEGEIAVDGKLDEAAWAKAARTALGGTRGGPGPKVGETWVKVLYDTENLYLGLHAADPDAWGTLKDRDAQTWTEEVLEIFIDPDGDAKDYIELQVTPNNVVFDARFKEKLGRGEGSRDDQINGAKAWNSSMKTAVFVDGTVNNPADVDKSWSVEISIPFGDLPGEAPKVGSSWKINFYRFDKPRDAEGKADKGQVAWAWAQPFGSFHNVERFGTLRFVGKGGPIDIKPTLSPPLDPSELPRLPEKAPEKDDPSKGEVAPDKPE